MKKIVPFNKVLKFDKDVLEINSISLEHKIYDMGDSISGEFNVLGDYIIDDDAKEISNFDFKLPFDIALGVKYDKDTMVVDIDDFRYEIVSSNEIRVDIDLYIDGEEIIDREDNSIDNHVIEEYEVRDDTLENDIIDNINNIENNVNENNNVNMNIFGNIGPGEEYVTYRIYTVMEGDTIDSIIAKYDVSLEDIKKYNDISNLKPMDKLIIPSNE